MNKLAELYDEIRTYEKSLIKPCLITKDTESAFEIWISSGNSSIYFSSIVLYPDYLYIKFNPTIIKEAYDITPNPPRSSYEYQVSESDIEKNIEKKLKRTILDLLLYSRTNEET
jgi:hypothetical protein